MGTTSDNGASPDFGTTYGTQANVVSNYTSDDTATGVDYQRDQSAANTFISTVAGSEDLHILSTSNAIGTGKDMGTSTTLQSRRLPYSPYEWSRDINDGDRNGFAMAWDIGASQYAIISTIGTSSRDYSTFTAWEADLNDTTYYGKGSVANGQMYKDSDYEWHGSFLMDGGGTLNLFATYLTVAEGQRHDGTPDTGVRFLNNGSYQYNCMYVQLDYGTHPVVRSLEWVEMDENGKGGGGCTHVLRHYAGGWGQSSIGSFNHCMIHNYYLGNHSAGDTAGVIALTSQYGQAHNNLLFNIKAGDPSGSSPFLGNLFGITTDRTVLVSNNTVYGLKHVDSTSGEAMGFRAHATHTSQAIYNNICVGNETQDFHDWGTGAVHSHNLSSDSSATGTGAVTGKSAASLFVSTTTGSEDLSLISTAPAIGVGKDLELRFSGHHTSTPLMVERALV